MLILKMLVKFIEYNVRNDTARRQISSSIEYNVRNDTARRQISSSKKVTGGTFAQALTVSKILTFQMLDPANLSQGHRVQVVLGDLNLNFQGMASQRMLYCTTFVVTSFGGECQPL